MVDFVVTVVVEDKRDRERKVRDLEMKKEREGEIQWLHCVAIKTKLYLHITFLFPKHPEFLENQHCRNSQPWLDLFFLRVLRSTMLYNCPLSRLN